MFAVGQAPQLASSLAQHIDTHFTPTVNGSDFHVMTDASEVNSLREHIKNMVVMGEKQTEFKVQGFMNVDNSAGSAFRTYYKLNSFTPGTQLTSSHLFGLPMVVIDKDKNVQINDNSSVVTFYCEQASLNPNYDPGLPKASTCKLENGATFASHSLRFANGLVDAPKIFIDSLPNVSVYVKVQVDHYNTNGSDSSSLVIIRADMVSCGPEQVVNVTGLCESCPGPSKYKRLPAPDAVPGKMILEACGTCPDNVFKCNGGFDITTKVGYQRLSTNTDEYIQCPKLGKVQPCLEGDKCIEGHTGNLCSQCKASYFMNFDGQCIKCGDSTSSAKHYLLTIVYWILFFMLITTFVNILSTNQTINRLSTGTYLMKSLINYFIYISLLTEIFASFWIHDASAAASPITKAANNFLAGVRAVYAFPLMATIEMA